MKRVLLGLVVLGMIAPSVGCSRIAKETMGVGMGAKSNVVEVSSLSKMDSIGPVTVEAITSSMDPAVPGSWLTMLAAEAKAQTSADPDLSAGKHPVKVSGAVVHLEGSKMLDQAFGPAPEVVVRVTVSDAGSGKVLGIANVVGRARGTTSSSQEDLCKAFGVGVVKWLKSTMK